MSKGKGTLAELERLKAEHGPRFKAAAPKRRKIDQVGAAHGRTWGRVRVAERLGGRDMTDERWKRHEREIAADFGTDRVLKKGRDVPDFETETVVGEVKSRQSLPIWLKDAVAQVRRYVLPFDGKLPVVCLKEKGMRGFLVVIHSDDFMDWYGELPLRQIDDWCRELLCPTAIARGLDVSPSGICAREWCPKQRGRNEESVG